MITPTISFHKNHKTLMSKLKLRANVFIHGPTGSGKTKGLILASKEVGLPFYKKLMGNQSSESSIIGYMSATGEYVKGIAYDPFVNGGILCLDEVDNGNPNTTLVANGLADREMAFPCGMKEAHKDFCLVTTANTTGGGATLEYCGRNRLDAAMLNRFEFIEWDYDTTLEKQIALDKAAEHNPEFDKPKVELLISDIISLRESLKELKIPHIISPRNTLQSVAAMVTGQSPAVILNSIILKGLTIEVKKKILMHESAKPKQFKSFNTEMDYADETDFAHGELEKHLSLILKKLPKGERSSTALKLIMKLDNSNE